MANHLDRENCLAAHPRLHELGKTPFRRKPVRRQQRNYRLALAKFLVKGLLPIFTRADPGHGIEIQEQRGVALLLEPGLHAQCSIVVRAAVADKYGGHSGKYVLIAILVDRKPLSGVGNINQKQRLSAVDPKIRYRFFKPGELIIVDCVSASAVTRYVRCQSNPLVA